MNYLNKSFSVYMSGKSPSNNCFRCNIVDNYLYKMDDKLYCKKCYDIKNSIKNKFIEYINNLIYQLFLKDEDTK